MPVSLGTDSSGMVVHQIRTEQNQFKDKVKKREDICFVNRRYQLTVVIRIGCTTSTIPQKNHTVHHTEILTKGTTDG